MRPSRIESLPRVARELIEREIREANFSGYAELAKRLAGFGKGVSKSSLHRYAVKLEQMLALAKFEAEVMQNLGDDAAYLLRWARSNPKAAARLVKRLQSLELRAKKAVAL